MTADARTHGFATRGKLASVYSAWRGMRQRCLNPKNPGFRYYGGRGITICARWEKFENFLADMGEPKPGFSLDRIDCDGRYEPKNCRWASKRDQVINRRKWTIPNHRGANNHRAVLLWTEVRQIRALKGTATHREIADQFEVSRPTISKILRGESYVEGAQ
jgi:hypothetical protein